MKYIRWIAKKLIRKHRDLIGDNTFKLITVGDAIPVFSLEKRRDSWFVPLITGDKLIGFYQLQNNGIPIRLSKFNGSNDYSNYPLCIEWIDTKHIQKYASSELLTGEFSETPFLTYYRSKDRLIWAIPIRNQVGKVRFIFVVNGHIIHSIQETGSIECYLQSLD